ncbi:hypothetical protein BSZ15_10560 [Bradyrhizobium canariense]|nr:hypothetical protein BSZ15_10560 [Bradyrhizobium canariense]
MLSREEEGLSMPVFDGKYSYANAGAFGSRYGKLEAQIETTEFVELARVFTIDTNRVRAFFELPLQLIFWSATIGNVKLLGRHAVGVHPEDDSRDEDDDVDRSILDTYKRLVTNPNPDKVLAFSSNVLGSMVGDDNGVTIDAACQGVEASFAAMIMSAYATFETLSADLWIAAVNKHVSLAQNWSKQNPNKQFNMDELYSRGGDISKSSGTALHQTRKVTFESLKEIRAAYSQAFKSELDHAFEAVPYIAAAEKFRHLFAHRGGLIDRKFRDEMDRFEESKEMVIGERLRLTGDVTGTIVAACVECGVELLTGVDNWSKARL